MKTTMPPEIKGFTLIELLLVIAILGILVVMGLASYTSSLQKGRDSKRKSDVRQIGLALESYFADKGRYPPADATGKIAGCPSNPPICEWGTEFTDGTTYYMTKLPDDTIEGQQYYYVSDATGTYFQLYTRLENTKDGDIPHNGTTPGTYNNTRCESSGDTLYCNYGVSSTNIPVTQGHGIQY